MDNITLCYISVWMFTACAVWLLITIAGISLVKLETSTLHQVNVLGKKYACWADCFILHTIQISRNINI